MPAAPMQMNPFPNYQPQTPNQPAQTTSGGGLQSYNDFTNLYNTAVTNPYNAGQQQQADSLVNQAALLMGGYNNQSSQLQQQAGFDTANLGLTQQQYGIQQGALNRQSALLPQLNDITNQQYGLQEQGLNASAQQQTRASNSAATASGAFTSVGHNQQLNDIQSQLQRSLQGLNLQRQQTGLNYKEQQASLEDSKKQLGIMESRLGISGQEISSRLSHALQQLGLSSAMSADQLIGELGKIEAGDYSPVSGLLGDIYAISGIPLGGPDTTGPQQRGGLN